jgi:cytochrome c-type biogenesis protein CcmH/NrfF
MPDAAVRAHPVRRSLWVRVGTPLVIVAVALAIGSGVFSGKPETDAQRAARIEAVIRCPSCIDVSVAQSQETTAVAVRHEIERQVARGESTAQIEQTLVDQYGQNILLEPPDAGGFPVIWIVPIVLGAGALVVVGTLFWRRSRLFAAASATQARVDAETGTDTDTDTGADTDIDTDTDADMKTVADALTGTGGGTGADPAP